MANETQGNNPSDASEEYQSETREVTDMRVVRSSDFVELYANYVSFAGSVWDMTVMFGRTVADDPRDPRLEQRAAVSLSPQTAKLLAHLLLRNLQAYEQQYGEIRITPIPPPTGEPAI